MLYAINAKKEPVALKEPEITGKPAIRTSGSFADTAVLNTPGDSPPVTVPPSVYESRTKDDLRVDAAYKSFCHTLLTLDPVLADEVMGASAVFCI